MKSPIGSQLIICNTLASDYHILISTQSINVYKAVYYMDNYLNLTYE